jgi:hypothetical protein
MHRFLKPTLKLLDWVGRHGEDVQGGFGIFCSYVGELLHGTNLKLQV